MAAPMWTWEQSLVCVTPAEGTSRWGNHLGSTQMEIRFLPLPGGLNRFFIGLNP